ncbi:LOW QUALITY PROTEIN: hypothetical protein Cgig2_009221 [Carnegiea gigantea]|uniref:Uncharacterized protein n=1 Tax=Carnegiea gigantea TaxID=171969 RepID=A0A9Q1GHP8_9CARY|nr:LOW QUALITY PROTEIN: hypothetical protein Cgig2_009221 [Carnegiea gigantea]
MHSLSKIGSILGIPLKTDKYTKEKSMLRYARLLVEMQLEGQFLEYIEFANDKNVLIRQKVVCHSSALIAKCLAIYKRTVENRLLIGKDGELKHRYHPRNIINSQGMNSPNKQEDIKIFLQQHQAGLVRFLETKAHNIANVMGKIYSNWEWLHNATDTERGRIIISWHPRRYQFFLLHMHDQVIHGKAFQLSTNKWFEITFVYGRNVKDQKLPL